MGLKYDSILSGGSVATYNDNPPADDGSKTVANLVKFVTITSDLTAPLHSAITTMDGLLVDLVDEGPLAKSTTYTTIDSDYAKTIECTSTFTLSLLDPSGNAGYKATVKNAGTGDITVDVDGGANINGGSSILVRAGESAICRVNAAGTAYYTDAFSGEQILTTADIYGILVAFNLI